MKYVVILGDGMADFHRGALGNKTPLEIAKKPTIDRLAALGQVGLIKTIDEGLEPGSDVANLSVIGYDPRVYYTGRSPLEALSVGVNMSDNDTVFRVNLVTISDEQNLQDATMLDYSAGEIATHEAHQLMKDLHDKLSGGFINFYGGTSYRNIALLPNTLCQTQFTPPHDILDKKIGQYLPSGEGSAIFINLMEKSKSILENHPINLARIEQGKRPANLIWFWGKGTKPKLPKFEELYNLKGAVISAVDLLKGIAIGCGMKVINVPGATGNLHTNFAGKAKACYDALNDHDYVYLHIEAPDECGHQGDAQGKIQSIEKIDEVVDYIMKNLDQSGQEYCIAVLPDHATPLVLRTHVNEPVPFLVFNSARPAKCGLSYTENEGAKGVYLSNGRALIQYMMKS
ncbi:MAG: cofactor-independent phosphoglycerate mutase [Clostridiales bacterium]|nr:cofactor-independent phosphoglycerate mutase [Clostridiales bacterium]